MKNLVILVFLLSFGVSFSTKQKGSAETTYLGCYVDAKNDDYLVLTDHARYLPLITVDKCLGECLSKFNINDSLSFYFGLEQDSMCYCGNERSNFSRYGPSNNCTVPCGGNKTQICGGHRAISVYQHYFSPCGQITPLSNGYINLIDNTTAEIGCLDGYQLLGSNFIQCNLSSSEWDITEERCTRATSGICEKLENPMNGSVHQDHKQANFSCDESFFLVGESVLYCLPTGNWSEKPPDCFPEEYLTRTVTGTTVITTSENRDGGLHIYTFTSLMLVAVAVLVVVIIILINLIVKTTTETKRIKQYKTDSTYAELHRSRVQDNESFWKSSPDLLKTSKSADEYI